MKPAYSYAVHYIWPRGVHAIYMTGGLTEIHIENPNKYVSLKFYTPPKNLQSKFPAQKNTHCWKKFEWIIFWPTDHNKNFPWRCINPRKYTHFFKTQKITEGVNFQPKQNLLDPHHVCEFSPRRPPPPPPPPTPPPPPQLPVTYGRKIWTGIQNYRKNRSRRFKFLVVI